MRETRSGATTYHTNVILQRNKVFYEKVFAVLDDYGISEIADLPDHRIESYDEDRSNLWVKEIVQLYEGNLRSISEEFGKAQSRPILYEHPYHPRFQRQWTKEDTLWEVRSKYACIFPTRVAYSVPRLRRYDPHTWREIPLDLPIQLLCMRPLLTSGLTTILPVVVKSWADPEVRRESWHEARRGDWTTADNVITVNADGRGWAAIQRSFEEGSADATELQYLRTPWLFGVDQQTFASMATSEEALHLYGRAVGKLLDHAGTDESVDINEVVEEVAAATSRLQARYEAIMRKILWKSSGVGVGTLTTVGTLLASDDLYSVGASLGAASIVAGGSIILDFEAARQNISESDIWYLWRSMRR